MPRWYNYARIATFLSLVLDSFIKKNFIFNVVSLSFIFSHNSRAPPPLLYFYNPTSSQLPPCHPRTPRPPANSFTTCRYQKTPHTHRSYRTRCSFSLDPRPRKKLQSQSDLGGVTERKAYRPLARVSLTFDCTTRPARNGTARD